MVEPNSGKMAQAPVFEPVKTEADSLGKLASKSKESPFVPIGLLGFVTVLGIGAYKYKNRGSMTTSMFLMQLRVASQGMVVGALTLGLVYSMLNEYVLNKKTPSIDAKPQNQ